jgi:hypothetical protein
MEAIITHYSDAHMLAIGAVKMSDDFIYEEAAGGERFYVLTRENLNRLGEAAIETASPATHLSCDWLSELKQFIKDWSKPDGN